MYSRNVKDANGKASTTTFGVSGNLWNGVLVMFDRATDSLWTQISGRAIAGERKGQTLEHMDSVHTTWSAWKKAHPDTLVLKKSGREQGQSGSRYADYLSDPDSVFMPYLAEGLGKVKPKVVVYGVALEGAALAIQEKVLVGKRMVNVEVGDTKVAFLRDPDTSAVSCRRRQLSGKSVLLEMKDGRVVDQQTGRAIDWDALPRVRVDRAFWYAWKRTHPESLVMTD